MSNNSLKKKQSQETNFDYKFGFSMPETSVKKIQKGLNSTIVKEISALKQEPEWMLNIRLKAFEQFENKPLPSWGADLSPIDFSSLTYFLRATEGHAKSWKDLPQEIKETYDRIGVPEAEKDFLAGVSAQYESEVVYESVQKELQKQGVLFCDMDTALKKYPDIVKEYFGSLIPSGDNKFSALNTAVWSGGSFVYVPPGVQVNLPLQAYFRINAESFGQFERTLIIADENSKVHYMEGCTAPIYRTQSLHSAVVEIFAKKGSHVRYTTVQNWSRNIYNLVTKRAKAEEEALMEWVDCNIGSKVTMKYPSIILAGRKARGEVLSISLSTKDQHQDTGAKMVHLAPETSSRIIAKSISKDGGRGSYRGLISISPNAENASSYTSCDALILDALSRSDTYPKIMNNSSSALTEHEATVEKIGEEMLSYLSSRGLNEYEAKGLIVNGFLEPITKEIPLEYSIELNRLITMEMEGSIG
ncbi:MAG: Fe-S cluster assembly protein SufB [Candidatus Moraniibacteriota bacterium]|nr:MAG: Fe-S cluster assembly protein SufB [Candidatus Moranbacteria bacterium]